MIRLTVENSILWFRRINVEPSFTAIRSKSFNSVHHECLGKEKNVAHIQCHSETPLLDQTIGQLLGRAVERWPNREYLVSAHQNLRLTFSETMKRVDRLAAGLKRLGLKHGDRLGIWGPNHAEWLLASLAASRSGLIVVAINPAYQFDELKYALQKVSVTAVISPDRFKSQNYTKMLLDVQQSCSALKHIIICSEDHATGTHRFADVENLASRIEVETIAKEQERISCYDGCNIQFTSGTTGSPKATLISHKSLLNNARQAAERSELTTERKVCLNVPFFHAFGLIMGQIASLHAGSTLVVEAPSFDPVKSLDAMVREKCDVSYGTPTMWINLMKAHERIRPPTQSLVSGTTGGAPAPPELFRRIRECFRFENMKTIYGLTETTGIAFQSMPGEDKALTETTVGYISDHVEAMVADDSGHPVAFGTPGELWIRGYSTMMRYWDDPDNSRKTLTEDGWLKTGDRFSLQANGYGQIIGRSKDMLIRGGENIFPKEIEDFLMTHPAVLEVHVIGAHDEVYGEEICACVRVRDGTTVTRDEIKNYCKGKIAHFKVPRYIEVVNEYPKTGSGKIQKYRLKMEMEKKGLIPAAPAQS